MIAIIGTGRMGQALGARLVELDKEVVFGSREPQGENTAELRDRFTLSSINEAVQSSNIVFVAVPYHAAGQLSSQFGDVSGKVIIDVTNALKMGTDGLMEFASPTSSGEELQNAMSGAKIVKAFNTVGAHIIRDPSLASGPVSVPILSDCDASKATVTSLCEEMELQPVDLGPMRHSRFVEGMAALYLTPYLQGRMGDAFEFFLRTNSAPKVSSGVRAAG